MDTGTVSAPEATGPARAGGPDELAQMAYVAHLHYREGRTRIEIAERLGISRFKVGRLLDKALQSGVVRLEITSPADIDLETSVELRRAFDLTRALAVPGPRGEGEDLADTLGATAARLLNEVLVEGDVLGLTSGRTINAIASRLDPGVAFELVALSGITGSIQEHGVELVRHVAGPREHKTWPLFSPLLVDSAEIAESLRRGPVLAGTYEQFPRVTVGVVAVGSWEPPDSQMLDAARRSGVADAIQRKGAAGEICATVFDREGGVIRDIEDQCIAIPTSQLQDIPEVIAVAGGPRKHGAIRAALRSGLVDSLITDVETARWLIRQAD